MGFPWKPWGDAGPSALMIGDPEISLQPGWDPHQEKVIKKTPRQGNGEGHQGTSPAGKEEFSWRIL